MSIQAISWAFAQRGLRSSEKFVLVCMSNYANENGICYASVAALSEDTCQDRKTVMNNIKSLLDHGYLVDTGKRIGETGSVVVYRLMKAVPKTVPLSGTKNGTAEAEAVPKTGQLSSTENGTTNEAVPKTVPLSSTKNGTAEAEAVPKTGLLLSPSSTEIGTASVDKLSPSSTKNGTGNLKNLKNSESEGSAEGNSQPAVAQPAKHRKAAKREANQPSAIRLPADFELTDERRAVAVTERIDPDRTFAKFKDYWLAASGARARKLDWEATWRNWCRNEADRNGKPAPATQRATTNGAGLIRHQDRERAELEQLKSRRQAIGIADFRDPLPRETASQYRNAQNEEWSRRGIAVAPKPQPTKPTP